MSDNSQAEQVNWLIDPKRGWLLPISGLWILSLDWILFSSNLLSAGIATPIVICIGFLLGGLGTLFLQIRFGRDGFGKALLKAFVAACVVGAPWPLAGTLVGGWVLMASGVKRKSKEPDQRS